MHERVDLAVQQRRETGLDVVIRRRPDADRPQIVQRRRVPDVSDGHARELVHVDDPIAHPVVRHRRRKLRDDDRGQDQRVEHPEHAEQPSEKGDRHLVAIADGRHRDGRPPESAEQAANGLGLEIARVRAPLGEPRDETDHQKQPEQQADRAEEVAGRQRFDDRVEVRSGLGRDRGAEAGMVERIGEVDDLLARQGDRHRGDRGVEAAIGHVGDHPFEVRLDEVELEAVGGRQSGSAGRC